MVDFVQTYIQAKGKLNHYVFPNISEASRKFFNSAEDQVLKLKKALYGTYNYGDYLDATLQFFINTEPGMQPIDKYPSFYITQGTNETGGLLGLL